MSLQKPASEAEARSRLSREFDHAIVLLSQARLLAQKEDLVAQDFAAVLHLCGESRNVPLTIAIHDLWDALKVD